MSGLIKAAIATAPLLVLLFWYTAAQVQRTDTLLERADEHFSRSWNEMQRDFAKEPEQKAKFEARAIEADAKLKALEKELALQKAKGKEFMSEFEREMKNLDNKQ